MKSQRIDSDSPKSSPETTAKRTRLTVLEKDISNGFNTNGISVVNEIDKDNFPKFKYNPYAISDGALPKREGCSCSGSCSSTSLCECVTLSNIHLDETGKVKNPQLFFGKLFESTFFQCDEQCGCRGKCSNFLAKTDQQQELALQIFKTPSAGYSCRAMQVIEAGTFICFLGGEVIKIEAVLSDKAVDIKSCFFFKDDKGKVDFCIRSDRQANESRFFNSSCCPNLFPIRIFSDTHTPQRPSIGFIAGRQIEANDELCYYYGDTWMFEELRRDRNFVCHCSAPYCIWPKAGKAQMEVAEARQMVWKSTNL